MKRHQQPLEYRIGTKSTNAHTYQHCCSKYSQFCERAQRKRRHQARFRHISPCLRFQLLPSSHQLSSEQSFVATFAHGPALLQPYLVTFKYNSKTYSQLKSLLDCSPSQEQHNKCTHVVSTTITHISNQAQEILLQPNR